MTNEEQKLREFADKWGIREDDEPTFDPHTENPYYGYSRRTKQCLSDLTALISEGYVSKEKAGYPKEFVEWIGDDCSPCYLERKNDDEGYGKWVVFKRNSVEHEAEFDTLDELFNYWKENYQ